MGERRVDLERLARLLDLLLLRQRLERAHVVEAVGELDQDDPDVRGHRDHHLAVVLGLVLVAALEGDPGQLGDAVDELGDRLAELLADLVEARAGVLDRVVEERRAERLGVEAQAGADLRHLDRVGDEVLARLAPLVGVALAGEGEGALDRARGRRRPPPSAACSPITAKRSPSSSRSSARQVLGDRVDGRRRTGRVVGADARVAAAVEIARRARPRGPVFVLSSLVQASPALLAALAVGPIGPRSLEIRALRGYDAEAASRSQIPPRRSARARRARALSAPPSRERGGALRSAPVSSSRARPAAIPAPGSALASAR